MSLYDFDPYYMLKWINTKESINTLIIQKVIFLCDHENILS